MLRKISLFLLFLLGILVVYYWDLLGYGWMQAKGQFNLITNVREISEILNDPSYPDSVKQKILLIQEIKNFGVDSLGLKASNNYTTYYDQQGKKLMWLLTASPPYQIEAYKWYFPIIGEFPYKGFFDSTQAYAEKVKLDQQGFDTYMGEAAAWSMLGYLRDPILSSMFKRSEGQLANLILHELTHGTIFVKGEMEFNENIATLVGDLGAVRFLNFKYGPNSPQLKTYEVQKNYREAWAEHMLRGAQQLDTLYASFDEKTDEQEKLSLKKELLEQILMSADTLLNHQFPLDSSTKAKGIASNNAYFISYKTYRSRQNNLLEEFTTEFQSDFPRYLSYLKNKYGVK